MFISGVSNKKNPPRKKGKKQNKKTVLFLAHDDPFFCSGVFCWLTKNKKVILTTEI